VSGWRAVRGYARSFHPASLSEGGEGARPLLATMTPSGPIAVSPWPPTRVSASSPMRPEEQGGVGMRGSEGGEGV
jgi:hypothetical protein